MTIRILRFGWLGSIVLALVAVMGLSVAIAVVLARPSAGGTSAPTATGATSTVQVSVAGARVLPISLSHLPAANHEFVAITVQLSNRGSTAAAYSVSDFVLRDQAGTTFDPDPGAASLLGAGALPVQGTLQPGARRSGEIVFQVPMSDHSATLVWQPAGAVTGGANSWGITI